MAMGDVIGRLSVVLGLDTAAFESGARRAASTTTATGDRMEVLGRRVGTAAKALVGLGAAIAGSEIISQVKDMALAGLEHASSLGEQAQQLGVTTGELQRYRYIATQVGIDQEVMDKGLAKLSITLGDLAAGAKAPTEALKRLGFSQKEIAEISKLSAGEAIPRLADGFARLKSPTEAAAIAADLFGAKMGGKFLSLLQGGKAGIDELTNAYKQLGIEISESQIKKADEAMDKMAKLQMVTAATRAKIAADNAPGILSGLEEWEKFKTESIVLFGQISKAKTELDAKLDKIPDPWETISTGWRKNMESAAADLERYGQNFTAWKTKLAAQAQEVAGKVGEYMRQMYQDVKTWIVDKLNAVWATVKDKIEQTKQYFFGQNLNRRHSLHHRARLPAFEKRRNR